MKIVILCVLFTATLLHAFTIPRVEKAVAAANQPTKEVQSVEPDEHKIDKRFIGSAMMMMNALLDDDDDYFDDFPLNRRRRPSRRTIQLAQMIRQLAGPQGLTRAQMQNMLQNLQNLQAMQNMQQLQSMQSMQGLQQGAQPQAG